MKTMKRDSKKSKRGLVLPVIAAIALCLALLGIGILQLGFGSRVMATRTMAGVSARAAADAGVTRALYELNALFALGDIPINTPMPPDVSDQLLNSSDATYSYKVRGPLQELPEPYWLIESIGKLGTQEKTVYATLGVRNLFDYGLIVTDQINLLNNNLVDGYDSRLGPYTLPPNYTNSHNYIRIGTTSIANNSIWLGSDTEITGDVLAGIGGEVDEVITNPSGAAITGPWYNLPEPWFFEPIIITVPEGIPNSGSITQADFVEPSITLGTPGVPTYLRYDSITVPNGNSLILVGDVVLDIIGDHLDLRNDAVLYVGDPLDPTVPASAIIYLAGDLAINNGAAINNLSQIPIRFQLFGTSQTPKNWNINNSGNYYGVYYGPNANIHTHSGAQFYGSISGYEFALNSNGGLHYDHALSGLIGYDTGFGIDRMWEKSDFVVATGP